MREEIRTQNINRVISNLNSHCRLIDLTEEASIGDIPKVDGSVISDDPQAVVVERVPGEVHDGGRVDDGWDDSVRNPPTLGHLEHGQLASRTTERDDESLGVDVDHIAVRRHGLAQVLQVLEHLRLGPRCPLEVLELGRSTKPLYEEVLH